MNKLLGKIYGPLVVLVDVVLLIDIVSDLVQKRKAKKAEKLNTEVIDEEETTEPEPVLWENASYKNRQNLQILVFPDGLIWDKETDKPRTIRENEALMVVRLFSVAYEKWEKEKTGKTFDFSGLVDYTDKFSNFFEDLLRLDRFAESVEDELNRIVAEEEGSRKDS